MRCFLVYFGEIKSEGIPAGKPDEGISELQGYDGVNRKTMLYWPMVSHERPPLMDEDRLITRAGLDSTLIESKQRPCLIDDDGVNDQALVIWWSHLHHHVSTVDLGSFESDPRIETARSRTLASVSGADWGSGLMLQLLPGAEVELLRSVGGPDPKCQLLLATMRWDGKTLTVLRTDVSP